MTSSTHSAYLIALLLIMGWRVGAVRAGETQDWRVLLEQDYESVGEGARLWRNLGASGPRGASFAGVSGRTSSHFKGGWQSYELRLGKGETLRERYYWMYHPLPEAAAADSLSLRFDLMGDAGIADTGMSLGLMGGQSGRGMATALSVGVRDGRLLFGTHGATRPLAVIKPHVWYRIELVVSGFGQPGEITGTLRISTASSDEQIFDVAVSVSENALPLRNLKIDRSRSRWRERGDSTASLFLDNLMLKIRE